MGLERADKKYFVETYGCQMNESDTERISGQLEEMGYRPAKDLKEADVVILNTCSIRQNAEEKVYGKIGEVKKLKESKPGVLLGIAGCMAQESKGKFCTYCIVPYVRGRETSRTIEDICREVKELAGDGYKEITLLGQNVNSYGLDFRNGTDFGDLIRAIDKIDGIDRVRYMTSHPRDMSFSMVDAMAESPKVVHHMHLPVQHGSNEMLRQMNRGYTVEHFKELLTYVREKINDVVVTTDLITGFPGETEDMHRETLALLKEVRFDSAYTFIYSPRRGTPAARMEDQIDDETKHRRLQELMNIQNGISLELNQQMVGKTYEVIAEGPTKQNAENWFGRTSGNKMIIFPKPENISVGDTVNVKVDVGQTWILKGIITE